MHSIFLALFGLGSLLWLPHTTSANERKTIDGFPCAEVAAFPSDPAELTRKQLFYAAHAYDSGDCGDEDDTRAYTYYKESAERGDGFAMVRLGYFFANGTGVDQNTDRARYWFRSYALSHPTDKIGEWDGMVDTLFYGEPLPDLFIDEMKQAAQDYAGDSDVLMRNYHDLSSGDGVHANPVRAKTWLMRAMELDDPSAHYEYAKLQRDRENLSEYVVHLRLAAEFNSSKAQVDLGKRYLIGDGVMRWPFKALVWFYIAQAGGENVASIIQETESLLDPLNTSQAKEAAAKFISDRPVKDQ